jgi:hypothetical protein
MLHILNSSGTFRAEQIINSHTRTHSSLPKPESMNTQSLFRLFSLSLIALLLAAVLPVRAEAADTRAVRALKQAIAANPSNAPELLSDALQKHPGQACDLIKAAIESLPQKNTSMLEKLTTAALEALPDSASSLEQCVRDGAAQAGYTQAQIDGAVGRGVAAAGGGGGGGAGGTPIGLVSGYSGLGFGGAGASGNVTDF